MVGVGVGVVSTVCLHRSLDCAARGEPNGIVVQLVAEREL